MLSGIGTLAGAVGLIAAAFIGRSAITDFRAQKTAEREIDHAEHILTLAYRLNASISAIRSPISGGHEHAESEAALDAKDMLKGLDKGRKDLLVQANVFYIRARRFSELFTEAYDALPFAKAYFGETVFQSLQTIIQARHAVLVYADAYAEDRGRDPDFSYKIKSTIWEGYGKVKGQDELAVEVAKATEELEANLLPILRSGSAPKSLIQVPE
jgi:hypothetical protein